MRASFFRIVHVTRKEIIQVIRDRQRLILVLLVPLIELFVFGYVVTTDIDNIELAVCDYSQSPESRAYIEHIERSGYFHVQAGCDGVGDTDRLLDQGLASVVLVIPPEFSARLKRNQAAEVMAALDASNSNVAMIAAAYLEQITLTQAVDVRFSDRSGRPQLAHHPVVEVEPRIWFNPELRSAKFMVPGVICALLQESLLVLTAIAIVREKEQGTMEQLIVTPLRPFELIVGKAIPYIVFGYIDVAMVVLVGGYWFNVPLQGSLGLLFALSGLFILTCLGIGLLVSAVSNTRQQAMMTGEFLILPNIFFSGFVFPITSMPKLVQWFTYAIPMRYYITIVRGIFLKGAGWQELWDEAIALLLYSLAIFVIASLSFRKQVA